MSLPADDHSLESRARWPLAVAAMAIVLVGAAAYLSSFRAALVLDDIPTLAQNESIRTVWPLTVPLSPPPGVGTAGRPLANLSFALNYAAGGMKLAGFHATNLALHLANALLVLAIVRRTLHAARFGGRFSRHATPIAAAAALLWVAHPVGTATVTYLSQRTEALAAFWYLLALYAFARGAGGGGGGARVLSVAAVVLGAASKETIVTAPVLLLLYDRTFLAGSFRAALRLRWRWYAALALSWAVLAALMVRSHLGVRGVGFDQGVSPVTYALTECRAVLLYLKLAAWPHPLVFDYGWTLAAQSITTAACVLIVAGIVTWAAREVWRGSAPGFVAGAFLLVLAPTSSVVPVADQPVAENRVYLPLVAVCALGAVAAYRQVGRRGWGAVGLAVAALAALTAARNGVFTREKALALDTVAKRPENARAHNALGKVYFQEGRMQEALAEHHRAAELRPGYAEAHANLCADYLVAGQLDAAVNEGRAALRLNPALLGARSNLGLSLLAAGQARAAAAEFETLVRADPRSVDAHVNLGRCRLQLGDAAGALHEYEMALELDPGSAVAQNNIGNLLLRSDRPAEAVPHYEAALRVDPGMSEARNNLGYALLMLDRPADAVTQLEAALRIAPAFASAHRNIAKALLRLGRVAAAIGHWRAALALEPDDADAHYGLGLALEQDRQPAAAAAEFTAALRLDPGLGDARTALGRLPRQK